jgi:hypothetical protein
MNKFTTTVKVSVCSALLLTGLSFALSASADDISAAAAADPNANLALAKLLEMDCEKDASGKLVTPDLCNTTKNAIRNGGKMSSTDCSTIDEKLRQATTDFSGACAKANLTSAGSAPNIACSAAMKGCDSSQVGKAAVAQDPNKPYDIDMETARFNKCPAYAGVDLPKLREAVEQQRKAVADMRKELPSLQKELLAGKQQAAKQQADLRKEQAQAQKEHSKEMRDIIRQASDKDKELQDKLNQLQNALNEKYAQIAQSKQKQSAAINILEDSKSKIRLNCYAQASAQVAQEQKDALGMMAAGAYNRGGQAAMLNKVGMSSRQAWQKRAKIYYDWCMSAQPTTESLKSANSAYNANIQQAEQEVKDLNAQIASVQQQMSQTVNPCGAPTGLTGESEACRNQRQTAEDLNQANADYAVQQAALNADMMQAQQDSGESNALNRQLYGQREQDLKNEQIRLTNLQDYYNLKYRMSGGIETEQGALGDAFHQFAVLKDVASSIVDNCATKVTTLEQEKIVKHARDFLSAVGIKLPSSSRLSEPDGQRPSSNTNTSTTPTTTAPRTTGPSTILLGSPETSN